MVYGILGIDKFMVFIVFVGVRCGIVENLVSFKGMKYDVMCFFFVIE